MWANKLSYIQWILELGKISPMTVRNNGFPFCPSAASNIPFEMTFPIFRGSRLVQTINTCPINSSGL